MAMLIRLKPYDAKKGHVIRRYTAYGSTFEESKGWYRVSDRVASYLADVHQEPNDQDSPLAFDVCNRDEAERIDQAEHKKAEERAHAAEPNVATAHDATSIGADLTTEDLRDPARRTPTTATTGRRT